MKRNQNKKHINNDLTESRQTNKTSKVVNPVNQSRIGFKQLDT